MTERGTGERREEEGLPSLLNQTCSGNSAHHQRRQLVKNKLICHLISDNSASICRALNPHGLLSRSTCVFLHERKYTKKRGSPQRERKKAQSGSEASDFCRICKVNFKKNGTYISSENLFTTSKQKSLEICWQQCLSSTLVSSRKQLLSGQNHLTVLDHR